MSNRPEPCFDTQLTDREGEVWQDVKGFDGLYSVSNHGRVRGEERYVNSAAGVRLKRQRILKQQLKIKRHAYNGLMQVVFSVDGQAYTQKVHQLVGRAFCRPLKEGEVYYRIDGDIKNNMAENIGITTVSTCLDIAKERSGKSKNYSEKVTNDVKRLSAETGISVKRIIKHRLTTG